MPIYHTPKTGILTSSSFSFFLPFSFFSGAGAGAGVLVV